MMRTVRFQETDRVPLYDILGGYFLGSSTELHWDVKLENATAMFETVWETEL